MYKRRSPIPKTYPHESPSVRTHKYKHTLAVLLPTHAEITKTACNPLTCSVGSQSSLRCISCLFRGPAATPAADTQMMWIRLRTESQLAKRLNTIQGFAPLWIYSEQYSVVDIFVVICDIVSSMVNQPDYVEQCSLWSEACMFSSKSNSSHYLHLNTQVKGLRGHYQLFFSLLPFHNHVRITWDGRQR